MMSVNLEKVSKLVRAVDVLIDINGFSNEITEENVDSLVKSALSIVTVSFLPEELEAVKRDITWKYKIYTIPGQSIVDDYNQSNWYEDRKAEITPHFWTRYKNYLIDEKKFSPNVVTTLSEETLDIKLMNYIGDPKTDKEYFRRGLIIGDVQSGKTSTYIGFICKAADAGYKVFILLTGTIDSLRRQTQERVEEGFVGIDMSADLSGGQRVGVGLDNKSIHAMGMTSRISDFKGNSDKIAVSLSDKDAVVFVIKKNTTVLKKLKNWLVSLNADPHTRKIDLPMLLIDDEADNASINTSSDKEDPTKINKLIRELASVFSKSNYVGFTATPFANVFIDPETTEKMETQDLFPEDFIVALPTPSNYIGPNQIFTEDGLFKSQLMFITDAGREEIDGFPLYFKHSKNWEDDMPKSLIDSIYTFYLANTIRDLRGDKQDHRSMLINISRFIKVQYYTKGKIEEIHAQAYRSIKYNIGSEFDSYMKDPILKKIYNIWDDQYSNLEFNWNQISEALFESIENIQIKVVNSSKNSEKLEYPKKESLRVIAIGGLALSRGLTLEGLVISYFYRNTCTYDVLMQMGRWFGYRKGYEDLFRIWTHKDSADWYAEIADATESLKADMSIMRENGLKPKDFGIRVRNNSSELRITAMNKMRNSSDEYEFTSYFGGIVETPYLISNPRVQMENFNAVLEFVEKELAHGYKFEKMKTKGAGEHYVLQTVPKFEIVDFLSKQKVSKYSTNFDINQITEFLSNCDDNSLEYWDIAFMDGDKDIENKVNIYGREIFKVKRKNCTFDSETGRLSIGRKGKLGGLTDGLIGITDTHSETAEKIINDAKTSYQKMYLAYKGIEFTSDKSYSSDTWFKFVVNRKPLLIIYLLDVNTEADQHVQAQIFRNEMNGIPAVGLAMGLPRNENSELISKNKFKANKIYNWFDKDNILLEEVEE